MIAVLTSPYVLGLILATAATLALGGAAYTHRDKPASVPFGALCFLLAAWAFTTCLGLLVPDEGTRLFLERMHWVYAATVPVFWLSFALEYSGYGAALTNRRLLLLTFPTVAFVAVLFWNPADLIWTDYEFVTVGGLYLVDQSLGPLTLALALYLFLVTLIGAGVIVRFGLTAGTLYRDQTVSLLVGVATPIVVSLFSMVDATPIQGLNMTPYALAFSAIAFGNAMFRYDFLENAPSTRRFGQHVVTKSLRDGVIVVDDRDRIVECNPVAGRVLGVHPGTVLGESLSDVVDRDRFMSDRIDNRLHLHDESGSRRYAVEQSPVLDQHDHSVGTVFVLRDVTETERREERLAVLNRVLRHNLRNDMNVVEGRAQELADELTDPEHVTIAQEIGTVARELVDLSYKARTVQHVMAEEAAEPRPLDAVVGEIVDQFRSTHPEATITVDVPSVSVARGDVVAAVLSNVVENAVEHAGPAARVQITGRHDDSVAEVTVTDDGPGIPSAELRAIERGEESALDHASGLGLWIVTWGMDRIGGSLELDADDTGTTVTLGFPLAGSDRDPDRETERWVGDDGTL